MEEIGCVVSCWGKGKGKGKGERKLEGDWDGNEYYLPAVDPDYEIVPGLNGDFWVFVAQDLKA